MASSSEDSDIEFSTPSKKLRSAISKCQTMTATDVQPSSSATLRKNLIKATHGNLKKNLRSAKSGDRKEIEDSLRELVQDSAEFHKKLQSLQECVHGILDSMERLEDRVAVLEAGAAAIGQAGPSVSYADVAARVKDATAQSRGRIDRLEYMSSEEERKRRMMHVTICHPTIDTSSNDLRTYTKNFLSQHMKMETREIDANIYVQKTPRDHTLLLILSHQRFKKFIYTARKRLREANDQNYQGLYINDNLTPFNASLLGQLKRERLRRTTENLPTFHSVYSFQGKVYAKRVVGAPSSDAVWIKNIDSMKELLRTLDSVSN